MVDRVVRNEKGKKTKKIEKESIIYLIFSGGKSQGTCRGKHAEYKFRKANTPYFHYVFRTLHETEKMH